MTYQAVRRTPRPGQPSSTRHLGLRRAGGYAGLAGAVPMLPPQRLAILGYDDADIGPRERYLPGPPLSHADGKHVAADPLGAAAARAHVEASAGAMLPVGVARSSPGETDSRTACSTRPVTLQSFRRPRACATRCHAAKSAAGCTA